MRRHQQPSHRGEGPRGRGERVRSLGILALSAAFALAAFPAFAADRPANDAFFGEQWYLRHIGAPEAWNRTVGLESVVVAVIDSGVDIDHPDLKDNIWRNVREVPKDGIDNDGNGYVDDVQGWDFVGSDNDPRPDLGAGYDKLGASHGTIGAGIIAARGDNAIGISGVTWQTAIMPLRVLDSEGVGDPSGIVRAVEYAMHNGARVINLSFVGPVRNDVLAIALRSAYDAGVLVVAAAGNADESGRAADLDRTPLYPVCLDQDASENFIYGVAATDDRDRKAAFSNYGAGCVDTSAPGTRIVSTQLYRPAEKDFVAPYGGYYSGTSVAAPVVSGIAALMFSLDRTLTPKQVMNMLTESSFNIDEMNPSYFGKLGRGRVDVAKAIGKLVAAQRPTQTPASTASFLPAGAGDRMVAAASGPGRRPEVRLFTEDGVFIRSFEPFAKPFLGGLSLAVGDFDGSGKQSIVVGAGPGGGPHLRIFNRNTQPIGGFFAFDQKFRGGVSVAVGDLDGDKKDEIVAGAGPGGGPHVRMFRADGTPIGGFFAFDQKFRGGVSVAVGDLDGDGRAEIIVGRGAGGTTAVRVYTAKGLLIREFAPFGQAFRRGVTVASQDVDDDGKEEIVVRGVGTKDALVLGSTGRSLLAFTPGSASLKGTASADDRVIPTASVSAAFGAGTGDAPYVTLFRRGKSAPLRFAAFESSFKGGVSAVPVY